jgi:DNA-binding transcriptional LysR family regulator
VAAAASLGLSQPTVWKQVHALEREFGVKLVEPHGRGCTMTAAGRLLVEMIGPAVESIASARERFRDALAAEGEQLNVAVTPRMLPDDIAPCVQKYHAGSPKTRFNFLEISDELVAGSVLERRADFGFTPTPLTEEQLGQLSAETAYTLEVRLITPKDHPLARRRTVQPQDLTRYPIINRPPAGSSYYPQVVLGLQAAHRGTGDLVHAGFASSIRRFVKMGYGIGILFTAPSAPPDPDLHERRMQRYFKNIPVSLIRRRGGYIPAAGEAFIRLVRQELGSGTSDKNGSP